MLPQRMARTVPSSLCFVTVAMVCGQDRSVFPWKISSVTSSFPLGPIEETGEPGETAMIKAMCATHREVGCHHGVAS